jgi:hypothetical protein
MTARPSDRQDPEVLDEGLYRTDAFHRNPIFAVRPPGSPTNRPALLVRSWDEALAIHGNPHIDDINPAWLGRLISGRRTASLAPYVRIERLPRAHWVAVGADGDYNSTAFDPLSGGAGPLPDEDLHTLIRGGLLSSLRRSLHGHLGPIGCEHSSGLDSNSIIGALRHGLGISPERLHTFNNENHGEDSLVADFRHFHGLDANRAHAWRPNWQEGCICSDNELLQAIEQLSAPPQSGDINSALSTLVSSGGTLLFSGFGGDQGLSHNGANVATDLVATGRWWSLVRWMGSRRLALRAVAGRGLGLASRRWAESKVNRSYAFLKKEGPHGWLAALFSEEGRNLFGPHLRVEYPIESDCYLTEAQSIRRRCLASWVAMRAEEETRMAAALGIRKEFPLLNEHLIATVLAQDPLRHATHAGQGRLIARMAFAPYLPPVLRNNPSKRRDLTSAQNMDMHRAWQRALASLFIRLRAEHHPLLSRWWNLDDAWRFAEEALAADEASVDDLLKRTERLSSLHDGLETLDKASLWLRWLEGERSALRGTLLVRKSEPTTEGA